MTFQAIAWDVDGTLVDSEPLHHRALLWACAQYGLDLSQIPEARFCGVHIHDVWQALRAELPADLHKETWLQAIETYYHAHSGEIQAMPGCPHTLRQLAAGGIKQACVSNSSRAVVEASLRALGVLDLIAVIITLDDVQNGKPDPEPYRRAVEALGLPADAVLAVEDSPTGVASARAAGLHVAFCGNADVPTAGVTKVNTLTQLLSWF
ncbi:HAD family phosphatase [Erwinia sp. JUb26]|uniref:HAD family hydrolase n=1 Tax=Erwinia sp. JUb26 TaxID=2485126 RepID=UPI000F4A292F|nr:HAD family phosphatase [Erwinia sp. JUb26]ROR11435.1 HAD superfamily hydrolase (TIGR01509 family) [Erwinia sp. JUb26]